MGNWHPLGSSSDLRLARTVMGELFVLWRMVQRHLSNLLLLTYYYRVYTTWTTSSCCRVQYNTLICFPFYCEVLVPPNLGDYCRIYRSDGPHITLLISTPQNEITLLLILYVACQINLLIKESAMPPLIVKR